MNLLLQVTPYWYIGFLTLQTYFYLLFQCWTWTQGLPGKGSTSGRAPSSCQMAINSFAAFPLSSFSPVWKHTIILRLFLKLELNLTIIDLRSILSRSFLTLFCFWRPDLLVWPWLAWTCFVDQVGLPLKDMPDSISQGPGLKASTTVPCYL